jgi:hypothetical protein
MVSFPLFYQRYQGITITVFLILKTCSKISRKFYIHTLLKQVYSFSTFLVKILSPSAVCFTYDSVIVFYFFSTEAATSFLPCSYSSQNSIVIVIVYIYDTNLCQKDLPRLTNSVSNKKTDLTMLIMTYIL